MSDKIKAWPEGRPDQWLLTNAEAHRVLDRWFKTHEYCHSMVPAEDVAIIIGADWGRESFNEFVNEGVDGDNVWHWSLSTEPGGNFAGHHLTRVEGRTVYVFDIGEVTVDDVEPLDPAGRPSPFAEFH